MQVCTSLSPLPRSCSPGLAVSHLVRIALVALVLIKLVILHPERSFMYSLSQYIPVVEEEPQHSSVVLWFLHARGGLGDVLQLSPVAKFVPVITASETGAMRVQTF